LQSSSWLQKSDLEVLAAAQRNPALAYRVEKQDGWKTRFGSASTRRSRAEKVISAEGQMQGLKRTNHPGKGTVAAYLNADRGAS